MVRLSNIKNNNINYFAVTVVLICISLNKHIAIGFSVSYISSHSILPRNASVSEGESVTFTCNVTGEGIKKVEWFKDKMRLPGTFYQSGNYSYISDLQLTAVTVSQAGAFECRTTVELPRSYKGYRVKTGMLFVKGNWTVLDIIFLG